MGEQNGGPRPEWKGWALKVLLWGTVYLLGTGLVILLAPFSVGAQVSVWAHTGLGLLWLLPFFWYLVPHLVRRWREPLNHLSLLGWMSGVLLLTVVVSGLVVTWQAAFGTRIDYGWDLVHIITGCAVGAVIVAHLLTAVRRARPGEGKWVANLLWVSTAVGVLLTAITFAGGVPAGKTSVRMPLPEGYGFRYGENPFTPSLARTDLLWVAIKDKHWDSFVEELLAETGPVDADRVEPFLEVARQHLQMDDASRRRGEVWVDRLGRYATDEARIGELERIAAISDSAAQRGALESLQADVRKDLSASRKAFEENAALRPEALAGSQTCGTTGCHEDILKEWEPSAHRYSSRSVFFQLIQNAMAESNGAESTRYCAGCHDPISLFSGAKNIFMDDLSSPGADEGVSCVSCHAIVQTDLQGNANYVLAPPERYLAEDSFLGRFLVRAYPRHHKATFHRPLMETPEFCAACHKQFIDEDLNRSTRVQLQNQYDAWKGSHWFVADAKNPHRADETQSLACRDCHMRLTEGTEPAGEDGKHRHHGFIAANQWLPLIHDLPGAEKHVQLTEEWLKGETVIPEIADRWPAGPIVPIRIEAPEAVRPGDKVKLRVLADNRKVGHTFPTGPLDVIQAWMEVIVKQGDTVVFHSGALDEDGFIQAGSWMFKAEGVDRAGHLIDKHNLWDMVGSRFRRSLFPGYSDREEYTFECACETGREIAGSEPEFVAPVDADVLEVTAMLHYRKVDQTLLNMFQPDGKLRAPVTTMSEAKATIRVEKAP